MPRAVKIVDPAGSARPLSVTRYQLKKGGERMHVRCGCCNEKLIISPFGDVVTVIEIGGVLGSVAQWQQILGPLLDMKPVRVSPICEQEDMRIDTKPGEKVIFARPNAGMDAHIAQAATHLTVGNTYTVTRVEAGSWLTLVYLQEVPDIGFNSVMFNNKGT